MVLFLWSDPIIVKLTSQRDRIGAHRQTETHAAGAEEVISADEIDVSVSVLVLVQALIERVHSDRSG
jgi:hypothetical protein